MLNIDCCWIQTISDRKNNELRLAAERGFNEAIHKEIDSINLNHAFSEQIIGLGHKIVIPDLNNDGLYGLSSFRSAGYRWLVAVPIMTYRVHGILGAASHNKKTLQKETAELIMVIAGLIGNALNKAYMEKSFPASKKTEPQADAKSEKKVSPPESKDIKKAEITHRKLEVTSEKISPILLLEKTAPRKTAPAVYNHSVKMKSYRQLHPKKTAS